LSAPVGDDLEAVSCGGSALMGADFGCASKWESALMGADHLAYNSKWESALLGADSAFDSTGGSALLGADSAIDPRCETAPVAAELESLTYQGGSALMGAEMACDPKRGSVILVDDLLNGRSALMGTELGDDLESTPKQGMDAGFTFDPLSSALSVTAALDKAIQDNVLLGKDLLEKSRLAKVRVAAARAAAAMESAIHLKKALADKAATKKARCEKARMEQALMGYLLRDKGNCQPPIRRNGCTAVLAEPTAPYSSLSLDTRTNLGVEQFMFDPMASFTRTSLSLVDQAGVSATLPPAFLDFDQSYFTQTIPKRRRTNPSFDPNYCRPVFKWESIPMYDLDATSAPKRNFLFVCERPHIASFVPTMQSREPLATPNTPCVDIWRRGERGMMLRNRLDVCHHYEISGDKLDDFVRDAKVLGITTNYYPADGLVKTINDNGHHLFLCNGGDFKGILDDMDLKGVAKDVFWNKDPTQVPQKNSRGNRGPSLLYTGSQSQQRGSNSQFAKPILVAGSRRYSPLYSKITTAIKSMCSHQPSPTAPVFPDPFPIHDDMPRRQIEWAGKIVDGNCVESCSFLIYYSEFTFSKDAVDKLMSHVDKGNGKRKGWDWLATFWEQWFDQDLRRWVLFVCSATSRASIEEQYMREGCIGYATNELIRRYESHPIAQRLVIPATLFPVGHTGDHRITAIHFDTLVYLSPLLWHVNKMRRYWKSRSQDMSIYLATEMVVGFFKTNNPLRYHRYAESVYQETSRTGTLAIPAGSTFLRGLERFLFVTYGGWNGNKNEQGVTEGSMRTQPCTIHPQSDWAQESALISWMSLTSYWAERFRVKAPGEKDHGRFIREIKDSMIGLGDLFSQKAIFADAALGMTLPVTCFNNCLPGSAQHMKGLKKQPFNFDRADQVTQLVTSISVKANLVREVAEEVVCLTLKGPASLSMYEEVSIKYCDLFSASYNQSHKRIQINRLDYNSRRQVAATRNGFTDSKSSHYYPEWARYRDVSKYCWNHIRMSSKSNFKFSIAQKSGKTQLAALERESVHFESTSVDFKAVQVLLNSNKYLHISDPVGELSKYLGVTKEIVVSAITMREKGRGFLASLDTSALSRVKLDVQFWQIDGVSVNRRPVIDVLNTTKDGWSYRSRNGAVLALFLHCVMNLHLRHADHWSIDYLRNSKEIIILLPLSAEQDTTAAVAAVYRSVTDDCLRIRQITNRCEILPPLVISHDYNRVYEKRRNGLK
jgi:hypothetical protein